MAKTLFIDFDGVLHDLEAGDDRRRLFEFAPILVKLLAGHDDVSLVVHSTWRLRCSEAELRDFLPTELAARVAGVIRPGSKYYAILEYAKDHGICDYRVLDDAPEEFQTSWPYLIVCDSRRGIGDPDVQRRIREFLEGYDAVP